VLAAAVSRKGGQWWHWSWRKRGRGGSGGLAVLDVLVELLQKQGTAWKEHLLFDFPKTAQQ